MLLLLHLLLLLMHHDEDHDEDDGNDDNDAVHERSQNAKRDPERPAATAMTTRTGGVQTMHQKQQLVQTVQLLLKQMGALKQQILIMEDYKLLQMEQVLLVLQLVYNKLLQREIQLYLQIMNHMQSGAFIMKIILILFMYRQDQVQLI